MEVWEGKKQFIASLDCEFLKFHDSVLYAIFLLSTLVGLQVI